MLQHQSPALSRASHGIHLARQFAVKPLRVLIFPPICPKALLDIASSHGLYCRALRRLRRCTYVVVPRALRISIENRLLRFDRLNNAATKVKENKQWRRSTTRLQRRNSREISIRRDQSLFLKTN